jgi:hypothetical protein
VIAKLESKARIRRINELPQRINGMLKEKLLLIRLSLRISRIVAMITRKEELCSESIPIGTISPYHFKVDFKTIDQVPLKTN